MTDSLFSLRELYQEMILDHGRSPRNTGSISDATHMQEGFNPLCGDKIKIYLLHENSIIKKIRFEGSGCAISQASASLMTEALSGKSADETKVLFDAFHALVTTGTPSEQLGKLSVMSGVSEFPARVKCATLAWHTLMTALTETEKTEESA